MTTWADCHHQKDLYGNWNRWNVQGSTHPQGLVNLFHSPTGPHLEHWLPAPHHAKSGTYKLPANWTIIYNPPTS